MKPIHGTGIIASIALIAGIFGGSLTDGSPFVQEQEFSTTETSGFLGHVTVVQTDKAGYVKHYSQGDNIIVDEALNCAPTLLFGEAAADTTDCPNAMGSPFDSVCIFQDTIATEGITDSSGASTALTSCLRTLGLAFVTPGNGTAQPATPIIDVATEASGATPSTTDIAYRYTGGTGINQLITSAGLFETEGDALFAANDFSGGAITLQESDTLDVTWSITLT